MTDHASSRSSDVSKRFVIRKEKSLKERLVNFGRSNLHKEDFWALRDVDLEIDAGHDRRPHRAQRLRQEHPAQDDRRDPPADDRARCSLRGRLAALLELGAGFHPDLTGRENVYLNASILGLSRQQTDRYFDAIVDFSGIEQFIDTQVKFYSSGMYVRLAFAVAVHVDPDILLVDEVLAVGDEPFQRKCLDRIRRLPARGPHDRPRHPRARPGRRALRPRRRARERAASSPTAPPREALQVLRADFEAHRQADIARAKTRAGESATRVAEFLGVSAHRPDGEMDVPIEQSGGMRIRLTIQAHERLAGDWEMVAGIANPLGTTLFSTSTRRLGVAVPVVQGEAAFEFVLDDVPLAAGDYIVQAELRAEDGAELHVLPIAARFSVEGSSISTGPLHVATAFTGP